jgi:hypothetical protein
MKRDTIVSVVEGHLAKWVGPPAKVHTVTRYWGIGGQPEAFVRVRQPARLHGYAEWGIRVVQEDGMVVILDDSLSASTDIRQFQER